MSNMIPPSGKTGDSRSLANWIAPIPILIGATFLHFYHLDLGGFFTELYYAAAVKSMMLSWHNFFFAAFDPGGFVNVDKPPLGFWIQAVSATLFGFNSWSLLFPQAIAGVLSVAVVYRLTARSFGRNAALIAALVLTVTPISIATNRNNTIDSQLVLVLLLAAWAGSIAAEKGQMRWLSVTAVLVGLGFNIKMLQAYMVLPALWFMYLLTARVRWPTRLIHLSGATLILLVVSFAWPVFVDATPPSERPYVGTSDNNSEMQLIFGQNGFSRLGQLANLVGWAPVPSNTPSSPSPKPAAPRPTNPPSTNPVVRSGQAGSPPPSRPPVQGIDPQNQTPSQTSTQREGLTPAVTQRFTEIGNPGILRLFNRQLAPQISWFIPLALFGLIMLASPAIVHYARAKSISTDHLSSPNPRQIRQLILFGSWMIPMLLYFSFGGFFHRHYLEMLAPAIAVLTGAGIALGWKQARLRQHGGRSWLLTLLIGSVTQIVILRSWGIWNGWLLPFIIIAVSCLILLFFILELKHAPAWTLDGTMLAGLLALLVAPALWSTTPLMAAGALMPFAGPELLTQPNRPIDLPQNSSLINYLRTNRNGAKFLVATPYANRASPFILVTGEPVMALGGYSGFDPILTSPELARRVASNEICFFIIPLRSNSDPALTDWVGANCRRLPIPIPRSLEGQPNEPGSDEGLEQLYDCRPG